VGEQNVLAAWQISGHVNNKLLTNGLP